MTYIDEITSAVVRVLEHACDSPPHRCAGYAANAGFWVGEVRHCLHVIAGHDDRFRKMKAAVAVEGQSRCWSAPPPTKQTTLYSDRAAAKRALSETARRFLARCAKSKAVAEAELIEHCRHLGLGMPL